MRLCAQTVCTPNCYLMGCDGAGKRRMESASCLCYGDKQPWTDAICMGTYKLVLIKVTMLGKGLIIIIMTFAQQVVEKRWRYAGDDVSQKKKRFLCKLDPQTWPRHCWHFQPHHHGALGRHRLCHHISPFPQLNSYPYFAATSPSHVSSIIVILICLPDFSLGLWDWSLKVSPDFISWTHECMSWKKTALNCCLQKKMFTRKVLKAKTGLKKKH